MWDTGEAARHWQQGAAGREQVFGAATRRVLDLAGISAGMRVLDIAAGTGDQSFLASRLVGPNGTVLATDISASMLAIAAEEARERGLTNTETRVADAQQLDVPDGSFDAAISRFGLMFLPDLHGALVRIGRALRPGGRLAAMVWSTPERNPLFALPLALARAHAATSPTPDLFGLGDPQLLRQTYARAGFAVVAVETVTLEFRAPSVAAFVEGRQGAIGPLANLFAALDDEGRMRLRAEVATALHPFEGREGLVVPGEALIAVGTR
jgi:SAM-dependent methyltransferase